MKTATSFLIICFLAVIFSTQTAKSQVYSNAQNNTANGLCIGCGISSAANAVDVPLSNYETMNLTVAILGAGITQQLHFPSAGNATDYLGIVVEDISGGTLSSALLSSISVTSYKNGISNGDTKTGATLSISLMPATTQYKMEYQATAAFDELDVKFSAGIIGALAHIRVYYAYFTTTGPLPIELLSFDGKQESTMVKLNWVTASEQNNDHFTVERSVDGIAYEMVDNIDGAGTTSENHAYVYTDKNPVNGTSYYRLKQTDYDGHSKYFSTIPVTYTTASFNYAAYPNPYSGDEIRFVTPDATTEVKILNPVGQVIFSKIYTDAGTHVENLASSLGTLPAGIYFISFGSAAGSKMLKEVIQ